MIISTKHRTNKVEFSGPYDLQFLRTVLWLSLRELSGNSLKNEDIVANEVYDLRFKPTELFHTVDGLLKQINSQDSKEEVQVMTP